MEEKYLGEGFECPPVLLIIFNRPDCTRKVFEKIRENKPNKLYIACDGPRSTKKNENDIVKETLSIVSEGIDWDCKVEYLIRTKNLGCKVAVSSAIDWFFQNESEGIILEDDCLPSNTFFAYCANLLIKYRNDYRVGLISGTSLCDLKQNDLLWNNEDYIYSQYFSVWGWATWKRTWLNYDVSIKKWPTRKLDILNKSKNFKMRFLHNHNFESVYCGIIDTWDYQLAFNLWGNSQLAITPKYNLIDNIGFDSNATHTKNSNSNLNMLSKTNDINIVFPLVSPEIFCSNKKYEQFIESIASKMFLFKFVYYSIKKFLKG